MERLASSILAPKYSLRESAGACRRFVIHFEIKNLVHKSGRVWYLDVLNATHFLRKRIFGH